MPNLVNRFFSEADLQAIAKAIAEAEASTSGEIRVDLRQRRNAREKGLSIEAIAMKEFENLGMTATKDRAGVLIFLLLEERQFDILADVGINQKVPEGTWQRIADRMAASFSKKRFREGVIEAIAETGKLLAEYFPRRSDDVNELPDEVRVT